MTKRGGYQGSSGSVPQRPEGPAAGFNPPADDITQTLVRWLNARLIVVQGYWCDHDETFYAEGQHHAATTCCRVLFRRPADDASEQDGSDA